MAPPLVSLLATVDVSPLMLPPDLIVRSPARIVISGLGLAGGPPGCGGRFPRPGSTPPVKSRTEPSVTRIGPKILTWPATVQSAFGLKQMSCAVVAQAEPAGIRGTSPASPTRIGKNH